MKAFFLGKHNPLPYKTDLKIISFLSLKINIQKSNVPVCLTK